MTPDTGGYLDHVEDCAHRAADRSAQKWRRNSSLIDQRRENCRLIELAGRCDYCEPWLAARGAVGWKRDRRRKRRHREAERLTALEAVSEYDEE